MNEERTSRPKVSKADGQSAYKRQLAYAHLGINPKDVECIPFFAFKLKRIARVLHGVDKCDPPPGPVRPLDLLQSSDDPEARKVLDVYLSVPESYRRLLPVEAFCLAAGVSPWRVLESITVVAVRQGAQAAAIIAAVVHPRVVEHTIHIALNSPDEKKQLHAQTMLHKAMGFLPPRG